MKKSRVVLMIVVLFCAGMAMGDATWVGGGTAGTPGLWSVGSNWDTASPPTFQEDTYITNGSYVNSDTNLDTGVLTIDGGSTVNVDTATMSGDFDNYFGTRLSHGTLNVNYHYWSRDNVSYFGGPSAAQPGVVNMNGPDAYWNGSSSKSVYGGNDGVNNYNYGVLNVVETSANEYNQDRLDFGYAAGTYGELNLSGGVMDVGEINTGAGGGTAVLNITGGTLGVSGEIWLNGDATIEVTGDSASINAGSFYSNLQSILRANIQSDVSVIDVSGAALFDTGAMLEAAGLLDGSSYLIMNALGGITDGGIVAGSGVASYDIIGGTELWITTVPEPATMLLLGLGALVIRRRK